MGKGETHAYNDFWPILKSQGWTHGKGWGLEDWCFMMPGVTKKTGKEGVDMFNGEAALDLRILVDRSVVEVFVQGGRAVFSKTFAPSVLYVPDTWLAVHAWGVPVTLETIDVHSMGCGWTDPPWQPHPQL